MKNKTVILANIHSHQISVDRLEKLKKTKKLTVKEQNQYMNNLKLLNREKSRLKQLEVLGEELYTKIYPYR